MSEKQKEVTIFDSRLREDEYIIWQGNVASRTAYLHPRRLLQLVILFLRRLRLILESSIKLTAVLLLGLTIIVYLYFNYLFFRPLMLSLIGTRDPLSFVLFFIFGCLALVTVSAFIVAIYQHIKTFGIEIFKKRFNQVLSWIHKIIKFPETESFTNPFINNQYVITNQRVLLYEDGRFQETSLILMQDAVKTKPRNGKSDINLYDRRSPTGQLPAPIATLNNLSEEDAETAYDLLVKARDLSFEERIEDLGLE